MVLYLSIIQPREAIRQFQRTAFELQLMFTFWREMESQVKERRRQISVSAQFALDFSDVSFRLFGVGGEELVT